MKVSDAPRPGWFPDPEGGSRLRWWDGSDWTDRYRARPTSMRPVAPPHGSPLHQSTAFPSGAPFDPSQIVEQVRQVTREEAMRATQSLNLQARQLQRKFTPLISEYTNRISRFLRRLAVLILVLVIAYVVFQVIAQQSFFNWLGDRIDNLSDN